MVLAVFRCKDGFPHHGFSLSAVFRALMEASSTMARSTVVQRYYSSSFLCSLCSHIRRLTK